MAESVAPAELCDGSTAEASTCKGACRYERALRHNATGAPIGATRMRSNKQRDRREGVRAEGKGNGEEEHREGVAREKEKVEKAGDREKKRIWDGGDGSST
eukprot:6189838-Pleurochrysis_carterae.AAC.1